MIANKNSLFKETEIQANKSEIKFKFFSVKHKLRVGGKNDEIMGKAQESIKAERRIKKELKEAGNVHGSFPSKASLVNDHERFI